MVNLSMRLSILYPTLAETYAASTVLPGLSICIVLLRFYARRLQKNPLGIDDWLMVPALAMVVGIAISLVTGIHLKAIAYPTPVDGNLTTEEQFSRVNPTISHMYKINYAFTVLVIFAFGFIKLSIIFLYRRLFVTRRGTFFDWVTKISISVVISWTISFFFGFIFGCGTHFSAEWGSFRDYYTYCGVVIDLMNPLVVSDLVSDVMILCLPLPVIWNLHMTTGRKLLVTGILAAGAVSIVAAIIKVVITLYITNPGYNTHVDIMDIDLTVTAIMYWSMVEAGLAIFAACLPNLYFLLRKVPLGSIMNSVRSALSLRSLRSQHSQRIVPRSESSYTNIVPDIMSASQMPMIRISGSAGSFRSGNKDAAEITGPGIYVTSQISQHESIV